MSQYHARNVVANNITTALHVTKASPQPRPYSSSHRPSQQHGGEPRSSVNSSCTEVCNSYSGKSCAKILQVNVFQKDNPSETHKMYAIIDDQSNRSLASPAFFDMFNILDKPENYTLSTCSGIIATSGRRGRGFVVESVYCDIHLSLPKLIECDHIPDNRDAIPTPQVVQNHSTTAVRSYCSLEEISLLRITYWTRRWGQTGTRMHSNLNSAG